MNPGLNASRRHLLSLGCLATAMLCCSGCSQLLPGPPAPAADADPEFTTTDSGLKYRILRQSDGVKPKPGQHVKVDYEGRLDDGTVFDSSYRKGKQAIFSLDDVVAGWTEGLRYVGEGGMIELEIPPELGYGTDGKPPTIPRDATLHFTVELIRVFQQ